MNSTGRTILNIHLKYNSLEVVSSLACDGTVTNIGQISGAVHLVELKLEKNLNWLVCVLHPNELPLKALFYKIDGTRSGPQSLTEPTGKKR